VTSLTDVTSSGRAALPVTVRIAAWSARHRWLVVLLWFVGTIGLFVGSAASGGILTQNATGNSGFEQTESVQGNSVFSAAGPKRPAGEDVTVVMTGQPGAVQDPAFRSAVADVHADLTALTSAGHPVFASVVDPLAAPLTAGFVAPDGTGVRMTAHVSGSSDVVAPQMTAVRQALAKIAARYPAYAIHTVSNTLINQDINQVVNGDLEGSLKITIPATFLILLLAFGAVAAAIVPLVLAITALLAAIGLLGIYSHIVNPVSPYATQLIVLIGLAVAVDYSLFMITRFRAERRRGIGVQAATEIASATAGRAVFFSGLAVMISVASLFVLPDELFHSMAIGTIAVILVAVIGSLTFLPATLAILGRRIDWGRVPWFGRDRPEQSGIWSRLVRGVMRRPAIAAVVSAAFLLFLASPVLALRLGSTDITAFPQSIDGVQAIEQLQTHWPQGSLLSLDVVVTQAQQPQVVAAIEQLKAAGLRVPGLGEPVTVTPSGDGTVARVSFVMSGSANDDANHAIVREMRSSVVPGIFGGLPAVRTYVTGTAATNLDTNSVYTAALPFVFAFVLSLSFLLLLVAFRSIVVPIKAIILNLLSTGAAYGVMVLVFEKGFLKDQLGVVPTDVIEVWVPIFVFAILFGLSMDYHVFILTRIKELVDRGMPTIDAVAQGISATSGTVTSAAAIMVMVFAVFATLRLVIIRELGLGLAVAVLVDATVIRSVLLPATMRLLGDWNWYLPKALGWLPRVPLEAEPVQPDLETPAPVLIREGE